MRIEPLRDWGTEELEPLFSEETRYWNDQILWDYRLTLEVIKGFIRDKSLPGFVLVNDGSPVGYSYFVTDRPVAFIGSLYVADGYASAETYGALIRRLSAALTASLPITRVETQLFEFNFRFARLFAEAGFTATPRYFLSKRLDRLLEAEAPTYEYAWWRLARWQDKLLPPAAEVVFDSYLNSYDFSLCRDYQSLQGCLRFLKNLVENPACGTFTPEQTLLALDGEGKVCGLLLATRTHERTGMIPQISIRREYQGRGLGSYLLRRHFSDCLQAGLERVTLSVSEGNERALRLYRRYGFEIQKPFNAYIWERR